MSEIRLVKGIDENKKVYEIFEGTDFEWAIRQGFEEVEVEQAYDGCWYLVGCAPQKPAPTKEEVSEIRRKLYITQKDPITCQIQSLRDEEQTEEVIAEIEALKAERSEIVSRIKEENPYPEE